jgi:RimJ/RimL family protein N-acetyltransferase
MDVRPVVLELGGGRARLEPMTPGHAPGLFEAGDDEGVWRFLPSARPRDVEGMEAYIRKALAGAAAGTEVPFVVIDRADGRVAGTTRYLEIQPANRSLEIGWTWLGPAWRRTSVNTECKYLLLRHAFETLGAIRVQLRTDARNERSRAAILRIGAVYEGCWRRSRILHDGFVRDSVFYSVLDSEWPAVKAGLERRLGR